MYLRFTRRRKNGKEHRYWSIVESKRCAGGRAVQRPVLYLGEINDSQHAAWSRVIEAFAEESRRPRQLALFPEPGGAFLITPRALACRCGSTRWSCIARANGARAGFPAISMSNSNWIGFWAPRLPTQPRGNQLAAYLAYARLLSTDRSGKRVAIASAMVRAERDGGSARRGLFAGRQERRCIAASTSCWRTRRRSSITCGRAGRICSAPSSRFCCTI